MPPKLKASLLAVTLLAVSIGNGEAEMSPEAAVLINCRSQPTPAERGRCEREGYQRLKQQRQADIEAAREQRHRDKLEKNDRAQQEQEQRAQALERRQQEAHQQKLAAEAEAQKNREREAQALEQRQQEAHQQRLAAEAEARKSRERDAQAEAKRHEEWKQAEAVRREQERQRTQEELARQAERQKVELDRYHDEKARQAEQQRLAQELADKKAEIDRQQQAKQKLAVQERAVKNAEIDRSSPAFPATNEEKGCELIQQVVPDYKNPPTRSSCQPMLETVKAGTEEVCVIALMATRMNALNEPVWQRPKGLTLVAQKACAMMKNGYGEAHVDRVTERMCSSSHDPQFISECRGAGYRN